MKLNLIPLLLVVMCLCVFVCVFFSSRISGSQLDVYTVRVCVCVCLREEGVCMFVCVCHYDVGYVLFNAIKAGIPRSGSFFFLRGHSFFRHISNCVHLMNAYFDSSGSIQSCVCVCATDSTN